MKDDSGLNKTATTQQKQTEIHLTSKSIVNSVTAKWMSYPNGSTICVFMRLVFKLFYLLLLYTVHFIMEF